MVTAGLMTSRKSRSSRTATTKTTDPIAWLRRERSSILLPVCGEGPWQKPIRRCARCRGAASARRAAGRVVGAAARHVPRPVGVHRLLDLGGVPGRALPLRPVPLAVLFAGAVRRFAARVVRPQAAPGGRPGSVLSPALLILWAPGGFRFTCYYYRGAYYKAFWADPPACAVGEPRKSYRGERLVPADHPERPPLLPLPRARCSSSSWPTTSGRRSGSPIRRPGTSQFGIGVGTLVLARQRRAARRLHVRLPLAAAPGRRRARPALAARPCARQAYDCVSCLNRGTCSGPG